MSCSSVANCYFVGLSKISACNFFRLLETMALLKTFVFKLAILDGCLASNHLDQPTLKLANR